MNLHLVTTTNLSVWSLPRISSLHKMSSWRENKTSVSGAKGSALRTRGLWCHSGHASRRRATCPPSGAAQVGSSAWKAHPPRGPRAPGGLRPHTTRQRPRHGASAPRLPSLESTLSPNISPLLATFVPFTSVEKGHGLHTQLSRSQF